MRTKSTILIISAFTLSLCSILLSSCKKDDVPPAKPKLSFSVATKTVKESDGDIEIKMKLDKGAFEDFKINYELSGTSVDKVSAGTTKAYDYEITSDYLSTKIVKGDSIGIIKIKLYSDFAYENEDETIVISIKNTDSDNIEITRNDDIKITVKQEDGMFVVLEWGIGKDEKYLDVDMDLFLWIKGSDSKLAPIDVGAAGPGFVSPEFVFLPSKPFDDGPYGLSCNYYEGTIEPMNFSVSFVKVIDKVNKPSIVRKGTYTLKNVNAYDKTKISPVLVLTFDKAGTDFSNFSEITIPTTSSRIGSAGSLPFNFKKSDDSKNKVMPSYLKKW